MSESLFQELQSRRGMGAEYRFVPPGVNVEPSVLVRAETRKDGEVPLSHTLPVPGGFSGRLEVSLKATSPVLFGVKEGEVTRPAYLPRRNGRNIERDANGDFVIPGRAARGMIRSVFRIATFSSLAPVNAGHRFGDRSPEYRRRLGFETDAAPEVKRGWLVIESRKPGKDASLKDYRWKIVDAAATDPAGLSIARITSDSDIVNFQTIDDAVAASNRKPKDRLDWWEQAKWNEKRSTLQRGGLTKAVSASSYVVVAGGFRNNKNTAESKQVEAVFGAPDGATGFIVAPTTMDQFFQTYCPYSAEGVAFPDGSKRMAKENFAALLNDYAVWLNDRAIDRDAQSRTWGWDLLRDFCLQVGSERPFPKPGIPIYYFITGGADSAVQDVRFGIAGVFKIAHRYSVGAVRDRRPKPLATPGVLDWTEALFGTVDAEADRAAAGEGKSAAIASRLRFSFARAVKERPGKETAVAIAVQGAPKASFAPFYLVEPQPAAAAADGNIWGSWDSQTALLAGHKRYPAAMPAQELAMPRSDRSGGNKQAEGQSVRTLEADVDFKLEIAFDNLHPLELGALLWSISFGDRDVFAENGRTPFRHVGGRLRNKGFGRLMPHNGRFAWLRQNPVPAALRLGDQGSPENWADLLMRAFEIEMGARLAGDAGAAGDPEACRTAFYTSPSITALLNLSDSSWAGDEAGERADAFSVPKQGGRTDFARFRDLRATLYKRPAFLPPSGDLVTLLGEVFAQRPAPVGPAGETAPQPSAAAPQAEPEIIAALRDPLRALHTSKAPPIG